MAGKTPRERNAANPPETHGACSHQVEFSSVRLRAVHRTVALRPEQARQIAEHLTAAGTGHPWTGMRFAAAWVPRHPKAWAAHWHSALRAVERRISQT
ncbi:hypothetical protein [Streptomyces xanthophaeus]